MALNIKNVEVESLARQVAEATGETKTEAIRKSLVERRDRLGLQCATSVLEEMEKRIREVHAGRVFAPVDKAEWDRIFE